MVVPGRLNAGARRIKLRHTNREGRRFARPVSGFLWRARSGEWTSSGCPRYARVSAWTVSG